MAPSMLAQFWQDWSQDSYPPPNRGAAWMAPCRRVQKGKSVGKRRWQIKRINGRFWYFDPPTHKSSFWKGRWGHLTDLARLTSTGAQRSCGLLREEAAWRRPTSETSPRTLMLLRHGGAAPSKQERTIPLMSPPPARPGT